MAMEIEYFELPTHWACALINGDESGLGESDNQEVGRFIKWMISEYGQCRCLDVDHDHWFSSFHDATRFGTLACDVSLFAFDVTKRR